MKYESRFCLFCGKEIIGKYRNIRKFCSRSCSASYNDKLKKHRTDSEKIKISKSLQKTLLKDKNYITLEDAVNKGLILNPNNLKFDNKKVISLYKTKEIKCKNCGKYFKPFLIKNSKITKSKICSPECSHKLKSLTSKEVMKKLVNENKHKGWQSRNILSYPELFWINVLNNNNIKYIPNKPIKHENKTSNYFLDFYITVNGKELDLEIDGKQHELKERAESDKKRDEYIKKKGIIVYRIKWNEIKTEKGKKEMKNKINNFLNFFNSL